MIEFTDFYCWCCVVKKQCWPMRWLLWMTSLSGYIRRVVEVHSEYSVKYMLILGKYMILNTMVMAKRHYDNEDICWYTWMCKVILIPSDERYIWYMTADSVYNYMPNITTGGIWTQINFDYQQRWYWCLLKCVIRLRKSRKSSFSYFGGFLCELISPRCYHLNLGL